MVIYDLVCANFHAFEGWFKDSDDYKMQQEAKLVCCPVCDSDDVKRKPTKLAIAGKKSNMNSANDTVETEQSVEAPSAQSDAGAGAMHFNNVAEQVDMLRDFVEKNFEDVGNEFSNEIRKIHYGESDPRGIRGQATQEEITDLAEEGIDTYSIPLSSATKKNLN